MSTASLYEPDEDDEASNSDSRNPPERSGSSPSRLRQSSSLEQDEENDPSASLSRASQTANSRLRAIRRKGLTAASADAYRAILKEAVDDLSPPAFEYNPRVYYQLGVVTWNINEREMFFNLLARKGKNAIREIADAIPSKSELEVQEYLKLLHKGLELQQLHERHHRSTTFLDIPAASEISDECRLVLDEFAEYVALREQEADDKAGTKKHGDFWIINADKAKQVEELLALHDSPPQESSIFLTASLLNIKRWIQLSERFFMNFGGSRLEDNWVNVAFKDESPSLTADAFADFYALAVSITRRIIQSALFFAMSRIRNISYHKAKKVRARDVRAALDVLNMKHNSFDFWVGLARRCNLEVADIRHKKGWKADYMEYDEVEDALSGRRLFSKSRERSDSRQRLDQKDNEEEPEDDEENDDDDDDPVNDKDDEYVEEEDDDDKSSAPSSPLSTHSLASSVFDEEAHADEEDIYAEYIDQQRSQDEEHRIRELLQCPLMDTLPPIVKTEDDHAAAPPKPVAGRKRKEDLVDWRERTLYRSEWEEYGRGLSAINEELAENRRKRRRIEHPAPFTRSSRRELRRSAVQELNHNDDDDDANMLDTSDGEPGEESHYEEAPDSDAEADVAVEAETEVETEMEAAEMTEPEERPVVEIKMEEDAPEQEDTNLPPSSGHESSRHDSAAQQEEDSDDGG